MNKIFDSMVWIWCLFSFS